MQRTRSCVWRFPVVAMFSQRSLKYTENLFGGCCHVIRIAGENAERRGPRIALLAAS